MKQTYRLTTGLIASAIALAMISTLSAQTATEGTAKVLRVKGPARYTTGQNVWQPVKAGLALKPGTIIQTSTEQGSFVDITFGEGGPAQAAPTTSQTVFTPFIPSSMSPLGAGGGYQPSADQDVIRIWENSALGIDKLSSVGTGMDSVTDTQLDLKAGHITGNVKKLSPASKYEIKLPNGVAGVRGTTYDLTSDGVVRVMVGSVVVAWVNPKDGQVATQVVTGGNQYDARSGQISALGAGDMGYFSKLLAGISVPASQVQTTFVADKTVVPVSPVLTAGGNTPVVP